MRSFKTDVAFGANLDVRELSFIKSFAKGGCVSSTYNPPVTAEFLRRVSLKISHGEVHGVLGTSGSGKSTLLKVIAGRLDGKIDGTVWLNGQLMTKSRFTAFCEYVDFNAQLLPSLTLEQTLHFHAKLSLNCKSETVNYRVFTLMQHFDLGPIAEKIVNNLSKAEFRRLLIAMHLIRDPILIIADDLLKDLDALSAFQVMSSLQDYCKRQARMALISMKCPRSDIYQLLTQITLLFYGEVVFSGFTKQMPHYFNSIGFKCPTTENPAVYYLSLASVDRETPESYAETQMKAMKLVEIFKERRDSLAMLNPLINNVPSEMPILSCFYGNPSSSSKFMTLFSRLLAYVSRSGLFIFGQCILPLFILLIAIFGSSMSNQSFHAPKSLAGTFFAMILYTALSAVWATSIQFKELRKIMFFETSLNLYNATLFLGVYFFFGIILDILSIGLSSFAMVWKITNDVQLDEFFSFFIVIWCVYNFYKLITLSTFIFFQSTQKVVLFSTSLAIFMSIIASGFLKSYQTFISASKYLLLFTFTSIERYGNQKLDHDFVNNARVLNCNRNEFREFNLINEFCRWKTGKDYLSEIYPDNILIPEWWIGLLLIFSLTCFVGIVFLLITQKCSQKKLVNLK